STPNGIVYVYSGADGTLIYQAKSPVLYDYFGTSIADVGDIDGNSKADIIVGATGSRAIDSGTVYIFISKTVPKGDLNFDSTLTIADITNLLNVVFIDNSSAISPCTADLNCDGQFSPADIVLELNRVFLGSAFPCS
ncbi:MAG: FG-GAP repeat protein, partial [Limisphaerales bacterium]